MIDRKISIRDFKSMVEGMDLVGGENWCPSPEQWKRIKDIIEQLDDEEPVPQKQAAVEEQPVQQSTLTPAAKQRSTNTHNPWETGQVALPSVPSSIPEGPVGMGTSSLTPVPRAPVDSAPERVKTPDIDSSGGYKSGFL